MLKTAIRMLIGFAVLLALVSVFSIWKSWKLEEEAKKEMSLVFTITDHGILQIENPTDREYTFYEADFDLLIEEDGLQKSVSRKKYGLAVEIFYIHTPPMISTEIDLNNFWRMTSLDSYALKIFYSDDIGNYFTRTVYYDREAKEKILTNSND